MRTRRREQTVDWNRRRSRNYELERAWHQLRLIVLFVVLSFVLGAFIKNVNPIAVLWEFLREFLGS